MANVEKENEFANPFALTNLTKEQIDEIKRKIRKAECEYGF